MSEEMEQLIRLFIKTEYVHYIKDKKPMDAEDAGIQTGVYSVLKDLAHVILNSTVEDVINSKS